MIEHLRRKNVAEAAEATVEVGKLLYLLGRHSEALQRFDDALEADDDRDQSYIDIVAFLVQSRRDRRRAQRLPSRPLPPRSCGLGVREGLHLTLDPRPHATDEQGRRSQGRGLSAHARSAPRRAAPPPRRRLVPPARTLRRRQDQLRPSAGRRQHTGKRAEAYFYEAMHRLEEGKSDDAHQLWQKVVETQMFSFFEFDMASHYLRSGAPTSPVTPSTGAAAAAIRLPLGPGSLASASPRSPRVQARSPRLRLARLASRLTTPRRPRFASLRSARSPPFAAPGSPRFARYRPRPPGSPRFARSPPLASPGSPRFARSPPLARPVRLASLARRPSPRGSPRFARSPPFAPPGSPRFARSLPFAATRLASLRSLASSNPLRSASVSRHADRISSACVNFVSCGLEGRPLALGSRSARSFFRRVGCHFKT